MTEFHEKIIRQLQEKHCSGCPVGKAILSIDNLRDTSIAIIRTTDAPPIYIPAEDLIGGGTGNVDGSEENEDSGSRSMNENPSNVDKKPEVTPPAAEDPDDDYKYHCRRCKKGFYSRRDLMKHIKEGLCPRKM